LNIKGNAKTCALIDDWGFRVRVDIGKYGIFLEGRVITRGSKYQLK